MQPILDAIPDSIRKELAEAMVGRGAARERAAEAAATIERALADWLYSGGHKPTRPTPDKKVKTELERAAEAAATLQECLGKLSVDANVRLLVSLQGERQGRWPALVSAHWNADPIEIDSPSRGLLSAMRRRAGEAQEKILLPANLAAKFSRFQTDLNALLKPMQKAACFEARKSGNEPLKRLFREVIWAWSEAVNQWPSEGIVAGHDDDLEGREALARKRRRKKKAQEVARATSPIPEALREMAAAILGEAPAVLNDAAFRRSLKDEKQRASPRSGGLLPRMRAKVIPTPPRGRPRKLS